MPGAEEVVALGGGFEDVGKFFDEGAELGGGSVEKGEEGVDEVGGGDGVAAVGGDGRAEGVELWSGVGEEVGGAFGDGGVAEGAGLVLWIG